VGTSLYFRALWHTVRCMEQVAQESLLL